MTDKDRELIKKWMQPCAAVPVDIDTVRILLNALKEQQEQEPVAWRNKETGEFCTGGFLRKDWARWTPLYTTPPRREWVGLTADEIWKCNAAPKGSAVEYHICMAHQNVLDFAEAIEAKLKEKNT